MATFRRSFALSVLAGLTALALAPAAGAEPSEGPRRVDRAQDCDELVPEKTRLVTGTPSTAISLDLVVLLDGIDRPAAEAIVTKAARSYAPLNIALNPTYKKVSLRPEASAQSTAEVTDLLTAAKAITGGTRPARSDAVLMLTSRDIQLDGDDIVGYADCIGGIRYPDRSFALAEAFDQSETMAGVNLYVDLPAKTAAHELGHLLGARHEQSNCAEGAGPEAATYREPSVCTLMTAYIDLQSRRIGSVEAGVIRAHAESYAAP